MNRLLDAVAALDRTKPCFTAVPERGDAFLRIGKFFEDHTRAGQAYDLRRLPCPIWAPIRDRLATALAGIDETDLRRDEVRAWQMYNSGVIVKSDEVVMGLDVIPMPRYFGWDEPEGLTQKLAALMDLLLVTHRHDDHYDRDLVRACLRLGKPVFMPASMAFDWGYDPNLHAVDDGWETEIDDMRIRARRCFHVWRETMDEVPLISYEVTCQEGYRFIYAGDVDYTKRFEKTAGAKVDLFFLPWRNPNELYEDGHVRQKAKTIDAVKIALERVEPGAILYQHCAELHHVYNGFPASYDIALNLKQSLPVPSELMFWGESIVLAPGSASKP